MAANYGRKLTYDQYIQCIFELYRTSGPSSDHDNDEYLQRQELELKIDYRLGVDFPEYRRNELWRITQRLRRHSILRTLSTLTYTYLWLKFTGNLPPLPHTKVWLCENEDDLPSVSADEVPALAAFLDTLRNRWGIVDKLVIPDWSLVKPKDKSNVS